MLNVFQQFLKVKVKVNVDLYSLVVITPLRQVWHMFSRDLSFTCTPHVHPQRNEPYLPLPSQPKLVLIYRPQNDGRLSCYSIIFKDL